MDVVRFRCSSWWHCSIGPFPTKLGALVPWANCSIIDVDCRRKFGKYLAMKRYIISEKIQNVTYGPWVYLPCLLLLVQNSLPVNITMELRQNTKVCIGFMWLRIKAGVGFLWIQEFMFELHKRQRISSPAERLSSARTCCAPRGEILVAIGLSHYHSELCHQ